MGKSPHDPQFNDLLFPSDDLELTVEDLIPPAEKKKRGRHSSPKHDLARAGLYEGAGVELEKRTKISDSQILEVIRYMGEEGVPLRPACAAFGLAYHTVYARIYSTPYLKDLDHLAREQYLRHQVRRMNDIVDQEEDYQRARLKCENIKWEAQRVARFEYGDNVVISGDKDQPLVVQLVSATDSLLAKIRGHEVIDVTSD